MNNGVRDLLRKITPNFFVRQICGSEK